MPNENNKKSDLMTLYGDLAHSLSIPDVLEQEIWKQGFAGPAHIPKLVFLSLYTGFLDRPVSLLIKGPSSSGKSFSLRMGKQFVPPKAYEEFEGMSEKALVYLKGLHLKHKHLIIGEASGMAEGNGRTLLRQLISEGKVRYATVQSTSEGLKGEDLPVLEGPCGLIMTTTATGIHHEDETRMISVNIQESPGQIAEALMAQALGFQKSIPPIDTAPWFALYDFVDKSPKKVAIPFGFEIAKRLPKSHDRIKRDFPQILSLIQASALIHSCTRDRTGDGAVIASLADYALVRNLVNAPLSEGLQVAVPEPLRALVEAVKELQNNDIFHKGGVSQSQLAERLGRDHSSISRQVFKAVKEGYLEDLNPGQGRQSKLIVGERKLCQSTVLPTADELVNAETFAAK